MTLFFLVSAALLGLGHGFAPSTTAPLPATVDTLGVVIMTPVGPFCPFRADRLLQLSGADDDVALDGTLFEQMNYLQEISEGCNGFDPARLISTAKAIDKTVKQWERLIDRARNSLDFSTREFCMLLQANLESFGLTVPSLILLLRWQRDSLRAVAKGKEPPEPPAQVDFEAMEQMREFIPGRDLPVVALQVANLVTATPFASEKLKSATAKEQYKDLLREHEELMKNGSEFVAFPPDRKCTYLDDIVQIEERWANFFGTHGCRQAMNDEYAEQMTCFLAGMSISIENMPVLLREAHRRIREDAVRELEFE